MIPLHAAWRTATDDVKGARHYLIDDRVITYTPNARALEVTTRTAARVGADRLVVVSDPRPTTLEPIGYAAAESAWVRRWFPSSEVLVGEAAEYAAVVAALRRAQVQHFICHGYADSVNPLQSALVLAFDRKLTLVEILTIRRDNAGARLAVLSSCDTDRPGTVLPDEVVSLPTGFIQAGFAGVIATQWAVRSEAISLLMARFYQLWRAQHHDPAEALRDAQRWLRDTTNAEKVHDLGSALTSTDDDNFVGLVRRLQLRAPDDRPYQHPLDWAVLSYHGS